MSASQSKRPIRWEAKQHGHLNMEVTVQNKLYTHVSKLSRRPIDSRMNVAFSPSYFARSSFFYVVDLFIFGVACPTKVVEFSLTLIRMLPSRWEVTYAVRQFIVSCVRVVRTHSSTVT